MKKVLIGLSLTLVALVAVLFVYTQTTDFYLNQEQALYNQVLDSETPTIYYYYQDTCHFCNSIKNQVEDFANIVNKRDDIDLVLVDMKAKENQDAWYDWETHNQLYGENTDVSANPNYISDPAQMKTVDDIKISGTPTMIYVKDGKVVDFQIGPNIFNLLEDVKKEFEIDYTFYPNAYGKI